MFQRIFKFIDFFFGERKMIGRWPMCVAQAVHVAIWPTLEKCLVTDTRTGQKINSTQRTNCDTPKAGHVTAAENVAPITFIRVSVEPSGNQTLWNVIGLFFLCSTGHFQFEFFVVQTNKWLISLKRVNQLKWWICKCNKVISMILDFGVEGCNWTPAAASREIARRQQQNA